MSRKPVYRRSRPSTGRQAQHPFWAKKVACSSCGATIGNDCRNADKTVPTWCHGERCSAARAAGHETHGARYTDYGDPAP